MNSPTISNNRPVALLPLTSQAPVFSASTTNEDVYAYTGAPNRIVRAYAAAKQSGVVRYLNRPGLVKPIVAGLVATAAVNAVPAVLTVALNGGIAVVGAEACSFGAHLWSKWGQNLGIAGTALGLVMGGKIARTDSDIQDRMQGTALTAAATTVVGQALQLMYRGSQYNGQNTGHEFLCLMPEIPGYNVLIGAPVALLMGAAALQAGAFVRSVARPDDEEASTNA